MITPDLKIDHSNENPLIESGYFGNQHRMAIDTNMYIGLNYKFTPILYNSSEILNTKKKVLLILIIVLMKKLNLALKIMVLLSS